MPTLAAVHVDRAERQDLPAFAAMEQALDARCFIVPYPLATHAATFDDPAIVYLRVCSSGEVVGFFILALEADGSSVEFRRIVVARKNAGIGQPAIAAMEEFCRRELQRERIWLDVFEHNARGRHIYEKLGYRRFDESRLDGNRLLLYEKKITEKTRSTSA